MRIASVDQDFISRPMLPDEENVTAAVGLYLLAIERLTHEHARATTKELASFLGINQSTVTEYLKRLGGKGLIHYEWRGGCALTETGEALVRGLLRRQRLLKTFMVGQLGYKLTDSYQESLAMHHTLSDRFADALDEFLGFPSLDPHGEVIPRSDAKKSLTQTTAYQRLTDVAEGQTVRVCYLPDWRTAQLDYLCQVGVVPGATVRVVRTPPLNEPLLLEIDGQPLAISSEIGRWVGVCQCDKAEST